MSLTGAFTNTYLSKSFPGTPWWARHPPLGRIAQSYSVICQLSRQICWGYLLGCVDFHRFRSWLLIMYETSRWQVGIVYSPSYWPLFTTHTTSEKSCNSSRFFIWRSLAFLSEKKSDQPRSLLLWTCGFDMAWFRLSNRCLLRLWERRGHRVQSHKGHMKSNYARENLPALNGSKNFVEIIWSTWKTRKLNF